MRSNILGQLHSSLNLREIMDKKKILLVNLSKGKLGEMPAKLLGMVFVMKFQAAAMSRANIPESERKDFCLYVDEFQNFATDSFESILSEARKYRLNLIVANQFMSQLTDKIRSAITGNAGSFLIGRVGFEDAEQVVKIFQPVFDAEDLQFMPNHTAVCKILIKGMPTSPFSMELIAPMGHPNPQLADALRRLSAAKYGRPRAEVELEIHKRLNAATEAKERDKQARLEAMRNSSIPAPGGQSQQVPGQAGGFANNANAGSAAPAKPPAPGGGSSFLDDWLAKRQKVNNQPVSPPTISPATHTANQPPSPAVATAPNPAPLPPANPAATGAVNPPQPTELRTANDGVDEIFIDLRGNIHADDNK
jgi:hypothetical protein